MAQFQVYRVPGGRLVLDLQTDLIETGTRVSLHCLSHSEPDAVREVDESGAVEVAIPERNAFRLYRYSG